MIVPDFMEVVLHHLEIFGLRQDGLSDRHRILLIDGQLDNTTYESIVGGRVAIGFNLSSQWLSRQNITKRKQKVFGHQDLSSSVRFQTVSTLRTLGDFYTLEGVGLEPVVITAGNEMVWSWLPIGKGGMLLIGSNLATDLVRLRQGDPLKEKNRPSGAMWGISGERPNYLFEEQIEGLPHFARAADDWCEYLTSFLAKKTSQVRSPILPFNASGAIVITGDDDQAFLEKYSAQLQLLQNTPITYFLHPLTRHTTSTLSEMRKDGLVDLGIHPDAIDAPENYKKLLAKQCGWFSRLTGSRPMSLRNHGFLNDGYCGHLRPWLDQDIRFSSNIPGLNGRALNSSLLPARIWYDNRLTRHWSIVTAIGDGIRYVNGGKSDLQSANCIFDLADAIKQSKVPGVIVINLHPQNVHDTIAMHLAVLDVIKSGFIAWNMRDCFNWFNKYDCTRAEPSRLKLLDRLPWLLAKGRKFS